MRAYARIKTRDDFRPLHLDRTTVYTLEAALERMRGLIGAAIDWGDAVRLAASGLDDAPGAPPLRHRRQLRCRAGAGQGRQAAAAPGGAFRPIYLRSTGEAP